MKHTDDYLHACKQWTSWTGNGGDLPWRVTAPHSTDPSVEELDGEDKGYKYIHIKTLIFQFLSQLRHTLTLQWESNGQQSTWDVQTDVFKRRSLRTLTVSGTKSTHQEDVLSPKRFTLMDCGMQRPSGIYRWRKERKISQLFAWIYQAVVLPSLALIISLLFIVCRESFYHF